MRYVAPILLLLNAGALALENPRLGKWTRASSLSLAFNNPGLTTREECDGQDCGGQCIPADAVCCSAEEGKFCAAGFACTTEHNCCADGEECDGPLRRECGEGEVVCGSGCAPSGSQCCDDILGYYCEAPFPCLSSSECENPKEEGDEAPPEGEDSAAEENSGEDPPAEGDGSEGSAAYNVNLEHGSGDVDDPFENNGMRSTGLSVASGLFVASIGAALMGL